MASRTTADVEVRIFGNVKDFAKEMNAAKLSTMSFQEKLLATSGIMKSWGRSMTMGITVPVVAGMALSVKAASDLEESMNKLKVVFGSASGSVVKFAETAADSIGMSKQQAAEAAATFGNLFSGTGKSQKDIAAMSTRMVQLAADISSFNNIPMADALEKIRSGLVGEAEPLRAIGVLLDDATLRQRALNMGLVSSTKDALPPAIKMQAAYAEILAQTGKQQGDFDRTSDSLANQLKTLKAQVTDLAAEIGNILIPIVKPVVGLLLDAAKFIGDLPRPIQVAVVAFAGLAAAIGPLLWMLGSMAQGFSTLKTMFKTVTGYLKVGPWAAETAAIEANTIALEANAAARGTVSATGKTPAQPLQPVGTPTGGTGKWGGWGSLLFYGGMMALAGGGTRFIESTAKESRELEDMIPKLAALRDKFEAIAKAIQELDPKSAGAAERLKVLRGQLEQVRSELMSGEGGEDTQLAKDISATVEQVDKLKTAFNQSVQAAQAQGEAFTVAGERAAAYAEQLKASYESLQAFNEATVEAAALGMPLPTAEQAAAAAMKDQAKMAADYLAYLRGEKQAATTATATTAAKTGSTYSIERLGYDYNYKKELKRQADRYKALATVNDPSHGGKYLWIPARTIERKKPRERMWGREAPPITIRIGTLVGTDEKAARQLADTVGRYLMRGVLRNLVGVNA